MRCHNYLSRFTTLRHINTSEICSVAAIKTTSRIPAFSASFHDEDYCFAISTGSFMAAASVREITGPLACGVVILCTNLITCVRPEIVYATPPLLPIKKPWLAPLPRSCANTTADNAVSFPLVPSSSWPHLKLPPLPPPKPPLCCLCGHFRNHHRNLQSVSLQWNLHRSRFPIR